MKIFLILLLCAVVCFHSAEDGRAHGSIKIEKSVLSWTSQGKFTLTISVADPAIAFAVECLGACVDNIFFSYINGKYELNNPKLCDRGFEIIILKKEQDNMYVFLGYLDCDPNIQKGCIRGASGLTHYHPLCKV